MVFNHIVHNPAQLGVYLRLLNVHISRTLWDRRQTKWKGKTDKTNPQIFYEILKRENI